MPFGPDCQYADFQACKDANSDRDDPDAYCAAIQRRTEGRCMQSRDAIAILASGPLPGVVADGDRPRLRLSRPVARQARPWYRISAKAAEAEPDGGQDGDQDAKPAKVDPETTVIDIYDEIGWFGTGAQDFVRDLRGVKTPKIEVHLNSPGGDVFDAIAIYNGLRQHKASVHVIVDSLAASSASFIAMAGDRITAMANAMLMIHDPHGLTIGNAQDMREMADLLDKHGDNIAAIYANRAGGKITDWRSRMLSETWYLAGEAHAAGLVDDVSEDDGRPVEDSWDLSVFTRRPDAERDRTAATLATDGLTPAEAAEIVTDPPGDARPEDAPAQQPSTSGNGGSRTRSNYLGGPATWYLPQPAREESPR